ncbi:MAG: TonB-dependent receptor [Prevotella sp.]|nr:TonB-dependent receptor [Prevotella sp.]MDD7046388.1 TonB-dependent receptor [Prevotella sp.]MDY5547072.1 TonB-dependent receptor [Prevotella sp.]
MYQQLKRGFMASLLLVVSCAMFAQKAIKGTVKDSHGEPMIGVSVMVGDKTGAITDLDGNFTLNNVAPNSVLNISYIGYKKKSVNVGNRSSVDIVLEEYKQDLDELVVIGYGVVKKRDLTGAVASLKSDDMKNVATSNAMQAMQAKIPGMDLQQSSGESGSGVSINLRGARSLLASNDPLILVDGVAYGSTLDINPSDIESMEVLKDASSTAIYGTRGANGVIIITTKRGKAGKTKVGVNFYNSFNSATQAAHSMYGDREVQRLMDKAIYQQWIKGGDLSLEAYNAIAQGITAEYVLDQSLADGTSTLDIYNDKSYTNWGDLILKNSTSQNIEVNVTGGNDKTNFNVSLGALYDRGLMKNDQMDRYNGKVNIDHKVNKMVKVGTSLLFTYKNWNRRNSGVYSQAMKMTTITHPYLTDGTINTNPNPWYANHCSPLLDDVDGAYQNNTESTRFFGNAYVELTPLKGLNLRSMFAVDRSDSRNGLYQDYQSQSRFEKPTTSYIKQTRSNNTSLTWDNTINYNTTIAKDHDLTFLLGHELTQTVTEGSVIEGDAGSTHYYKSSFYDLSKILTPVTTSSYVKTSMLSFFGRVNYSYASKYLLTASLRADGSSTLAKGHKWGYFPSVAAGWRLIEEDWLKDTKWLSNLKLRASWGLSGNAAIDAYSTLATLSTNTYYYYLGGKDVAGNIPSSMGNSNLTWEKTSSFNLGLDFGFLNGRISGSIDYYWNKTYDLLFYKTGPASSFPNIIDNIGKTKGQGLEVSLTTDIVRTKDFDWTANWSYSHFKDEITELTGGVNKYVSGTNGLFVGNRVNAFYDYRVDGEWGIGEFDQYVDAYKARHDGNAPKFASGYGTPGSPKICDSNDNGTIDSEDRVLYNKDPNHVFGMNNTFTYKDFSLSVQLMARLGGYIAYDMNKQLNYESANWGDIDYWTPSNQGAKFPNPGLSDNKLYSAYTSAFLYEKADYLKIKDITLSYNVPAKWLHTIGMSSARVYCSMKNFITWSKIDNYDPERGGSIAFPMQKQVVLGFNVVF